MSTPVASPLSAALKTQPRILGASVIGPHHVKRNLPCQDACAFVFLPSGFGVVAVADGLGSAAKSEIGARKAVEVAAETISQQLAANPAAETPLGDLAWQGVFAARQALETTAVELGCPLDDLGCTLMVLVLRDNRVAGAHMGDGAVVVKSADGWQMLSGPEDSEYVNEVTPLTAKSWDKYLRLMPERSGIDGLLAFTDGCQRAVLQKKPDGYVPFPGFCEPILAYVRDVQDLAGGQKDLEALLGSEKLCKNSDDDKTLVVVAIPSAGNEGGS